MVDQEAHGNGVSRRQLMALAGGSAAMAFLAACGDSGSSGETSQFGDGDVGILNYVLTLEYLEVAFYADLIRSGLLNGQREEAKLRQTTMARFGEEETEHVDALIKAIEKLGADPVEQPEAKFPLKDPTQALELAGMLEDLGAAAYLGQLPKVESSPALETMLSIHSVEGRHASTIGTFLGKSITPDGAFAKPAGAKSVLEAIEPFMVD